MKRAPSERFGYHAPWPSQLSKAEELGIEIPEGISREGLSHLLQREWASSRRVRIQAALKQVAVGVRIRNKRNGHVYRICSINLERGEVGAYNETAGHGCSLGLQYLLKFYEVISDDSGN